MRKQRQKTGMLLALLCAAALAQWSGAQTLRHVWTNSPNPHAGDGYLTWGTAATNIQNAIDASVAGDLILVTNGVYATGGMRPGGTYPDNHSLTSRVTLNKPVIVRSVNGPSNTIIVGQWHAGYPDGPVTTYYGTAAIRCAWLTNGAELSGFMLTNGATDGVNHHNGRGGGAWLHAGGVISNCVIAGNRAWHHSGGTFGGTVRDSRFEGNFGDNGGGSGGGTFYNCVFVGNSAFGSWSVGGGVRNGVVYDSLIVSNIAGRWGYGGGAADSTLYNCRLIHNTRQGAYYCSLYDCVISNNISTADGSRQSGGGAAYSVLSNCVVVNNNNVEGTAATHGGGVFNSTLYNSTLKGNRTTTAGGGGDGGAAYGSVLYNCAVMGNVGGANRCTMYNCAVSGNSGSAREGGASYSTLYNCTVTGNSAERTWTGVEWLGAGGTLFGTNFNSIVYGNNGTQSNNYDRSLFSYSCTFPLPGGTGNTTNDPMFLDPGSGYGANHVPGNYRLPRASPCMNKGLNFDWMTNPSVHATNEWLGRDLDGGPRIRHNTVDMGAYETRVPRGSAFTAE